MISYCQSDKLDGRTLCMLGCVSDNSQHVNSKINKNNEKGISVDGCFILHYEACRKKEFGLEKCTISLNDGDIHCYPYIVGLLVGFADRVIEYARLHVEKLSGRNLEKNAPSEMPYWEKKSSDLSKLLESESSSLGHLGRLKDSLSYYPSDWKNNFAMCGGRSGDVKFSKSYESNGHVSSSLKAATSGCEQFVFKLSACRIKLHFHDSSCTIGVFTVPSISSAVFIYEDFMDICCSIEGLLLNSSCWRSGLLELLWGPVSKDFCPVLDIRVWNAMTNRNPQLEVSIGVQHVRCILPTEYLALLMGYFSLPDWTSNPKQHLDESSSSHADDENSVVYKIKVVDSDLIVPSEEKGIRFIRLEIPHLYSSINLCNSSVDVEDISCQSLVDGHKLAGRSIAFNISGRQLNLSLLLLKDEDDHLILDQDTENRKLVLIAPLTADIWVRVPKESGLSTDSTGTPVCINARINNCELIADGKWPMLIFLPFHLLCLLSN